MPIAYNEPKCADCKKMIQPMENHMVVDQKPYCLKCHQAKILAEKEKMGEKSPRAKPPKDDGDTGIIGTKGGARGSG